MSTVSAPIVASVWKLLVEVGESVDGGQPVAVLESMKMEIPVHAPTAGVVVGIPVTRGQIVQEGESIVELS